MKKWVGRFGLSLAALAAASLAATFTAEAQSTPVDSSAEVENVRVTDASSGFPLQASPTIVLDGQGRILAGWEEKNEIDWPNRVGFGRSLDGGLTWERSLVEVAAPDETQRRPWLALDESDRLYYARDQGPGLVVSRSDDDGLGWGPMVNIHDQPDSGTGPSMQGDGNGTIYASYINLGPRAPLDMKVIATRSVDGGMTWGPSKVVVSGLNPAAPAIATRPNGTAHIVWWRPASPCCPGGSIMVSTTTDRGATWGSPVRVNSVNGSALYSSFIQPNRFPFPSAATNSGGGLFVAWADTGKGDYDTGNVDYDIVVARSDDGGATWSAPVQVNDTDAGDQWMAALTVDGNDVLHAAWFDARTGNINLYYAFSQDGGRTWSPNLRITTEETPSNARSLGQYLGLAAGRNGVAHLLWTDGRDGGSSIYYARTAALFPDPADRAAPVQTTPREGKPRDLPPRN